MKRTARCAAVLALLFTLNATFTSARAQGTAFTYQGRLNNHDAPANGSYDLAFALYTTNATGTIYAGPVTNAAVAVVNGVFTTTVDFGNVFNGTSNWLEIAVSTNSANVFSTLTPRQLLTPVPTALYASAASNVLGVVPASQISGSIPAAALSGTIPLAQLPGSVVANGSLGVNLSGTFRGNGSGLTNLNVAALVQFQGSVVGWGDELSGQASMPSGLGNVVAIACGYEQSLALRSDGTVADWGAWDGPGPIGIPLVSVPTGLSNVVAIAGGVYTSLALKSDGTVLTWGNNILGGLNTPAGLSNVVAIAGGSFHSLALKSDGTVVAWGYNSDGQLNVPAGLSNVVAIAAGGYHSLALKGDGTVVAWGAGVTAAGFPREFGQSIIPAGLSNVVSVAAGFLHSLALKNDGTVVAWGSSNDGALDVPAGLNNVVAIAAGVDDGLALKNDGTVVAWGFADLGETNIPAGLNNVVAIASGAYRNLALRRNPAPAPVALLNGNNVFQGAISAAKFTGDGSGLTNLPVTPLPLGLVTNNATGLTLAGNFFGNFGGSFFGTGGGLTGLNPSSLMPGTAGINISGNAATATTSSNATIAQAAVVASLAVSALTANTAAYATSFTNPVADAQLSANIARLDGINVFTGTNTFNGALIITNPANQLSGTFTGNGSGLSGLNPNAIAPGLANINISGNAATATTAATATSAMTAASATSFTNPVADAQLSPNIARLNGTNVFTSTNIFSGVLIATNPANQLSGSFTGNGGGLTNMNLAQAGGVLSLAQLPAAVVTNGAGGVALSGTFIGTFSGLGFSPTNFGGALTVTPTPVVEGFTGGNGYGVIQGNNLAGIAAGLAGVLVYDVSVPANPVLVVQTNQGVFNLGVSGGNNGLLFFASGTNGLAAYWFTNALAPVRAWQTNVPGSFVRGAVAGNNYLYVAATPNVLIYAITNPGAPVLVGQLPSSNSIPALALDGNATTLYFAGQNGLQTYSLTNPAVPALLGSLSAPPAASLTLDNTRIFLACSNAGFRIIDVSSPTNLVLTAVVSNVNPIALTMHVAVAGNRAYVANYFEGLRAYDLTVITNPVSLRVYTNGLFPRDVTLSGPYAYVAGEGDGLRIYGVGDVANFSAGSSSNAIASQLVGVTVSGGGAQTYVFSGNQGQSQSIGGPNQVSADFGTIGGGVNNAILPGSLGATIAGGVMGHIGSNSLVAFIGGGFNSSIGDNSQNTVIGGGDNNSIGTNSSSASILGGGKNLIGNNANNSTIGGGSQNVISNFAQNATIPGGNRNAAGSSYTFAAGNNAKAVHPGSFVWADSQPGDFASTGNDQASFRVQGGVRFTSGSASPNTTVSWTPGNASWSFTSDRNTKDRIAPVDPQSILQRVAALPINEWSYIGYGQRHIGPMAQDFHAQFPFNENDKALNDADLHGVALAAIQGLNQKLEEQKAENVELKARLEKLEQLLNAKAHGQE